MEYLFTYTTDEGSEMRISSFSRDWAEYLLGKLMDEGTEFTYRTIQH